MSPSLALCQRTKKTPEEVGSSFQGVPFMNEFGVAKPSPMSENRSGLLSGRPFQGKS